MQRNLFRFTHLFIYRTCKKKTNYLESCISLLTAQMSTSIRTTVTEELKHTDSSWLWGLQKKPSHFRADWCIPPTRHFYVSPPVSKPWPSLRAPPTSQGVQSIDTKSVCSHRVDTPSHAQGKIQITLQTVPGCVQKLEVVQFSLRYVHG